MWKLAIRQLIYERTRSLLSIFAIASSVAVILIIAGFEQGLYIQSKNLVLQRNTDLVLTQAGVENFHVVRSSLAQSVRAKVEAIEGIDSVSPTTALWIIHSTADKKMPLFLLVYDNKAGPQQIFQGNKAKNAQDIVVDLGLAKYFDLSIGDDFIVNNFRFTISGITKSNSALFSPTGYITYDGLLDFILSSDITSDISTFPLLSFLFIDVKKGYDKLVIAENIKKHVAGIDVFALEELANNDIRVGQEMFGPIMKVLIALSFIIALLIIMIIVYSEVSSHKRQFGILKALGFSLNQLIIGVSKQLILRLIISLPFGLLIAYWVALFIEWYAPVYLVAIFQFTNLMTALTGAVLMSFIGGLLPLSYIAKADPLDAFKVE